MSNLFDDEVCMNEDELADLKERMDYFVGDKQDVWIKVDENDSIVGIVVVIPDEPAYIMYTTGMSSIIREVKQYEC